MVWVTRMCTPNGKIPVSSAQGSPYGLNIIDNCLVCPVREQYLFCNLPTPTLQKLSGYYLLAASERNILKMSRRGCREQSHSAPKVLLSSHQGARRTNGEGLLRPRSVESRALSWAEESARFTDDPCFSCRPWAACPSWRQNELRLRRACRPKHRHG